MRSIRNSPSSEDAAMARRQLGMACSNEASSSFSSILRKHSAQSASVAGNFVPSLPTRNILHTMSGSACRAARTVRISSASVWRERDGIASCAVASHRGQETPRGRVSGRRRVRYRREGNAVRPRLRSCGPGSKTSEASASRIAHGLGGRHRTWRMPTTGRLTRARPGCELLSFP